MKDKVYGFLDKAWQVCVGCSPHQKCAPRCWARKTVARIVECQANHPDRAEFFRAALSDDLKRWSGKVLIDEQHLHDPIHWRKPATIAAGFHADIGLLDTNGLTRVLAVACGALRDGHRVMFLSKQPHLLVDGLRFAMNRIYGFHWKPPDGIFLGCSLMTQADADAALPHMRALAEMGWQTHVWAEPQIGPINWRGWGFLKLIVQGGESGPNARPLHPQWARDTRDWCHSSGVRYFFKQFGEWAPVELENVSGGIRCRMVRSGDACVDSDGRYHIFDGRISVPNEGTGFPMRRVGKKAAGHLLDGREWRELPEGWRP